MPVNVQVIVGQRGVGKTALLERWKSYRNTAVHGIGTEGSRREKTGILFYDLDRLIAEREGQSVAEIFATHGEDHFRQLEKKHFESLLRKYLYQERTEKGPRGTIHDDHRGSIQDGHPVGHQEGSSSPHRDQNFNGDPQSILNKGDKIRRGDEVSVVVAVGGGFDLQLIPPSVKVLWLQRVSDSTGRIFLDRPPLEPRLTPLEEFFKRAPIRAKRFQSKAWQEYLVPEGLEAPHQVEEMILREDLSEVGGIVTLLPEGVPVNSEGRDSDSGDSESSDFESSDFETKVFESRRWKNWISKRLQWGLRCFEVRDDLLSEDQIKVVFESIPKHQILWSRRTTTPSRFFEGLDLSQLGMVDWDWPLWKALGEVEQKKLSQLLSPLNKLVLSFHHWEGEYGSLAWAQLQQELVETGAHIKWALEIPDFKTLRQYHLWSQENPEQRSFLPRTKAAAARKLSSGNTASVNTASGKMGPSAATKVESNRVSESKRSAQLHDADERNDSQERHHSHEILEGRWQWYRLWMAPRTKISFWREGIGSSLDQPTLFQWVHRHKAAPSETRFAALLGDPVDHSRTPMEQQSYFEKRGEPVFAIKVPEAEFSEGIAFLQELGLRAAAVTSPLKGKAFEVCGEVSSLAQGWKSVNTLCLRDEVLRDKELWCGENTDGEGFAALIKEAQRLAGAVREDEIAVWGGGGTLGMMREILPEAAYFSVQTGQRRPSVESSSNDLSRNDQRNNNQTQRDQSKNSHSPRWVIWASGSYPIEGCASLPAHWAPTVVIDLNYREDSGGRELALKTKAIYISGLTMFRAQAAAQRRFWL